MRIANCKAGEIINVSYPMYKGYGTDNSWVLISGDKISFTITSSDLDLKDYCILTDATKECDEYFDLELDHNYTYTFNKKGNGDYSFYVRVRDDKDYKMCTRDTIFKE